MKLSIVDLGTVAPDTTESDALADSLALARHAERFGFHRVWFAEHHLSRSGASHHPELLIAAAATQTSSIRLGSGAVLMNHYSPFKVAEMFQQLEAMTPGRIDLGMGRATGGPVIDLALQQDRSQRLQVDHQQQVLETLSWLYGTFPEDHPFTGHPLMPTVSHIPQTWLLGSSPNGSNLAAGLGIGYTFAGFINPSGAAGAMRHYRESFQPGGFGLESPRAILAVNVTVGEDQDEGERLVGSAKGFYARLGRMGGASTVPSADVAARELTAAQQAEPTTISDGQWPRFVAGGPDQVRATLEQMIEESGADELMVQNLIADPADRLRSHELLADIFALTPAA
ncbi:MsnO8 family LLM class oxidoreductase [Ornithinimicrobium faecis]|uniref:MsnO8 family LLM class oxidoreductase n=1 Tax=Ornithinimicrobium faecis TaxID=2934158 RepID=A0ABY4YYK7_9MICO|nr:MsnO8 family LLM class oxidoreductase [Ornithinimicrobium sp. HY1793]USQ81692.1 MsnO8 family LLM class oxidoreductase [Ornithinimicrobium sp. HY1793]